uniref:Lactate/malate dehydrogenase C-terminal domain-containing protein n=1 Tax=Periophthalmus magnuspinnatus TaxID=409849 RepID=A0A3B4AFL6_9GOBI
MARFVLAGKADCPCYAKAEYLADTCQKCLPDFSLRKIPIHPEQWQAWLDQICFSNSWTHTHSPLVWREVGLGSKGLLLGGLSDFMEHCQAYYNMTVELPSELMLKISQENMAAILDQNQEQEHLHTIKPLHVWICSPSLVLGLVLILDQLRALQMETQDLAAPRLHQGLEQGLEQDLDRDLEHYRQYGRCIESLSGSEVRVVLFSCHRVNQKCSTLLQECPRVNRKSFVTVATHLENHARVRIADKLKVRAQDVHGLLIWGDVCGRFFVDVQRAEVHNSDRGITPPGDLGLPLPHLLQLRSDITQPTYNSGLTLHNQPPTQGLVLSVPVRFSDGSWTFVSDLNLHKKIRETLLECTKEQTRNQD